MDIGLNAATQSDKRKLRSRALQARRSLTPKEIANASVQLATHLRAVNWFRQARKIAFYQAMADEIDPIHALHWAIARKRQCYLPMIPKNHSSRLGFARYQLGLGLVDNRFGIAEPTVKRRHWLCAQELDLLLVPLVAFDSHGNRLGMGGGYYDRALAPLLLHRYWQSPKIIGIAHECQRVSSIPHGSWDVPLNGVMTNHCYYSHIQ